MAARSPPRRTPEADYRPIALMIPASAIGAPVEKGPSAEARAAGDQFARQLGAAAQMVSREYLRPVPTADLYAAAVGAIYDAARRPQPATLLSDLKNAKTETDRIDLVKRARAAVHGAPELDDGRDLVAALSSFTPVLDPYSVLLPNGVVNGPSPVLPTGRV